MVPGGKTFSPSSRVSRAVYQLLETYAGRYVIAVAHGGTIRAALALALGLDPEAALAFTIENCFDHPHRPHRRCRHGSRLARRHGQPPAAMIVRVC